MKILLCNLAIRPQPTTFPPVACTNLCNVLIREGYDPIFYDIDVNRPSEEELSRYFEKEQFNIVGISAVVSTGYRYAKMLASIIKKASSKTQVILGGNLAAAYEVILRKCQIDICVIGEGERVILNLVKYYEKYRCLKPKNGKLHKIKSIAFLEKEGMCKFTGSDKQISSEEMEEPDYELLDRFSNVNQYISDPMEMEDFLNDPRSHEKHRQKQKVATLFTSKGCINRCTFCHRWINGYRVFSVEKVVSAMKKLIDEYGVGFFCFSDECFGENKKWLDDFIKALRPLDILFQVGGARVSMITKNPLLIGRLKEIGLTAMYFGMESGSDRILKIMEKNATVDENLAAAKLCAEAGVFTAIQLVVGMPGENNDTIDETIEFIKTATRNLPYPPKISVNYLQSLPGTPSYEYLRSRGLIGKNIEDEEDYLLRISDLNAAEFKQYINVTEEPLSKVKLWRKKIVISARLSWLKNHGWTFSRSSFVERKITNVSFVDKMKSYLIKSAIAYRLISVFPDILWKIEQMRNLYSLYGLKKTFLISLKLLEEDNRSRFIIPSDSLRRIVSSK